MCHHRCRVILHRQTGNPRSVCGGSAVFGIKPEKYRKDRSLIYIKNPASGNLEGFFENELCEHLSDEVQEIR